MNRHTARMPFYRRAPLGRVGRGFTLIEVMITVAIIAILTAIALPSYRDYVLRGYLVDATSQLAAFQAQMERYYQDNRTYASVTTARPAIYTPCDANTSVASRTQKNFVLTCNGTPSATTYSLQSTGTGPVNGFVFFVDNNNLQSTTIDATKFPGWLTSTTCWVVKKGSTTC